MAEIAMYCLMLIFGCNTRMNYFVNLILFKVYNISLAVIMLNLLKLQYVLSQMPAAVYTSQISLWSFQ